MQPYFHENDSIAGKARRSQDVLAAVAGRFIGSHPKLPPVYRIYRTDGFRRGEDYRYDMDLQSRWPELEDGQYIYVWGKVWSETQGDVPFSVSCYSPVRVFINQGLAFASNLNDDVFPERKNVFRTKLNRGWNHIVLEFVKTGTGCGGVFGTGSIKGFPMHILAPTPERNGEEGWVYSRPQAAPWEVLPGEGTGEVAGGDWYPQTTWSDEELQAGCFGRIFGLQEGQAAFAWTKLEVRTAASQTFRLQGEHHGPLTIYINGSAVYESTAASGQVSVSVDLGFGQHDLVARSVCCGGKQWGFQLEDPSVATNTRLKLAAPCPVEGLTDVWLYLGPFSEGYAPEAGDITQMNSTFGAGEEITYWQADLPYARIRPYLETGMYGKWNYPLGVTLYGIMKTGLELETSHYFQYAADHIEQCTSLHEYSMWDQQQYGSPGINHQLTLIDSLDDCGSFGAAMLEAHKIRPLAGAEAAAERIARYIMEIQDRLPNGTLYRVRGTTDFMKDTVWCDDLYMSTPFLSKYYELTGNRKYVDDAVKQFLHYKELMYIPELQIMHHVYDVKFGKGNGVPWGRGNGWVLFSLTELLAVLPENHELRPDVLAFFRELCQGYKKLQGTRGLWHQVLTDPESYEEASCTSMFIYAFARGVRFGWLQESDGYIESVLRGWEGLVRHCIDKHGNVYGVCRGSGYSFNKYYYKDQLTWQLNDTHGIGIVLLAGIETIKLEKHLCANDSKAAREVTVS
ncbi:glycoside hydrolase family 88/105 protein [Paenibacillus silviterrae]|uniref:glycoside hydrolase family 88/105 protein n=1 Tax=Paenibacillus silviterrae TaxID=3242194 RepID=UPI002543A89C|nr:glycoside hydrolase family 88 protein [Paenibacillus chinjuensis]